MKQSLLMIILFVGAANAQGQSSEQVVLDLSEKKFGWMVRSRYDSLEAILDDRLMFVHSNGWTESKLELIQDLKSGKLKYVNIEVAEAAARLYGSTAIVTGKGKFTVVLDGKDLSINLYYTEVYILKAEQWLLASRHANRMP